jgi:hypothetical protein
MIENRDGDRVSLDGLDPVAALKALLAVDPDSPPVAEADEPSEQPKRDTPTDE